MKIKQNLSAKNDWTKERLLSMF